MTITKHRVFDEVRPLLQDVPKKRKEKKRKQNKKIFGAIILLKFVEVGGSDICGAVCEKFDTKFCASRLKRHPKYSNGASFVTFLHRAISTRSNQNFIMKKNSRLVNDDIIVGRRKDILNELHMFGGALISQVMI